MAQSIKPPVVSGGLMNDENGQPVNAHGAGMLQAGDIYYLFGEVKQGATRLVPGLNWEGYRVQAGGVSCFSSKDLLKWTNEGIALAAVTGDSSNDLDTGRVIERPKVIYNEQTKKFVMWMHVDKEDYSYARAGVAVSDNPQGPYKYLGSVRPNGQMSRDITLFKDDDKKAYLIYSSEDNHTMQVCLLTDDYLSPTSSFNRILINQYREAPAVFKQKDKYFLITSFCSGWSPNPALYSVADSLMGKWENRGNPCVGPHSDNTFDSQCTFVLPINGADGSFLFLADRWNKLDLQNSGYLWLPLTVREGKVEIRWVDNNFKPLSSG